MTIYAVIQKLLFDANEAYRRAAPDDASEPPLSRLEPGATVVLSPPPSRQCATAPPLRSFEQPCQRGVVYYLATDFSTHAPAERSCCSSRDTATNKQELARCLCCAHYFGAVAVCEPVIGS
eukprot:2097628-Pleurochrysis_carterae.AAC.2